jgi:hypothetical protein
MSEVDSISARRIGRNTNHAIRAAITLSTEATMNTVYVFTGYTSLSSHPRAAPGRTQLEVAEPLQVTDSMGTLCLCPALKHREI